MSLSISSELAKSLEIAPVITSHTNNYNSGCLLMPANINDLIDNSIFYERIKNEYIELCDSKFREKVRCL